jgi:hypothetical protein
MAPCHSSWFVSLIATHFEIVTTRFLLVAIPHAVTEDDIYDGYFIPKGESWDWDESTRYLPMHPFSRHSSVDKYMVGYIPPQSWVVLTLFRAILHDPATYPEPDKFKPERFLNADGSLRDDPTLTSGFGFGKRICPGRHFVDATLFIFIASLLSAFNIEKGKDGGDKLSDYISHSPGITRYLFDTFLDI